MKAYHKAGIYMLLLFTMLLFAEVGNRYTSYSKEGSFFMIYFWTAVIAGLFSIFIVLTQNDK